MVIQSPSTGVCFQEMSVIYRVREQQKKKATVTAHLESKCNLFSINYAVRSARLNVILQNRA